MSGVTVLIRVGNPGDRLPRCLQSVTWADDIFCVVDTASNDGSEAIARQYTQHVVVHVHENAAAQWNWALPQVTTEWTLVLDADEWVAPELAAKIHAIIRDPQSLDGYWIRRRSYFLGKLIGYCGWQSDYNLRVFRTAKGRYQTKHVHPRVILDGQEGRLHEPMFHEPTRDFEEYFRTFLKFTTWSAQDLVESGHRVRLSDLTLRPGFRFFKMYIVRQGFRDGFHGAVLCGLAAFSVFTKYAKAWNMTRLASAKKSAER